MYRTGNRFWIPIFNRRRSKVLEYMELDSSWSDRKIRNYIKKIYNLDAIHYELASLDGSKKKN
jgi:hypothetical protein